jgi:hypothetical protein
LIGFYILNRNSPAFLILFLFVFFSSCNERKELNLLFTINTDKSIKIPKLSDYNNIQINIINESEECGKIYFKSTNGIDYSSVENMLKAVVKDTMTDNEKAIALWRLVSETSFYYDFDYNDKLPDNKLPSALIRFPYLMCGEKAEILVKLAKIIGLDARVLYMDGHIASEIYYENKWHLFDADHNIVFYNENKQIASLEELKNNNSLVTSSNALRSVNDNFNMIFLYKKYANNYHPLETVNNNAASDTLEKIDFHYYLEKEDCLNFNLTKNNLFVRTRRPRYTHQAKAIISRKYKKESNYFQEQEKKIIYSEKLPFFIKKIKIKNLSPRELKVLLIKEREHQSNKFEIIKANESLEYQFEAPNIDVFYSYKIIFDSEQIIEEGEIEVETFFEINTNIFPFLRSENIDVLNPKSNNFNISIKAN